MQTIDDDAKILGINEDTWHRFKTNSQKAEQAEFENITNPIDDREAFIRRKQALAKRWFGYYKKCKDQQKKVKLIDQYNYLAQQRGR